MRVTSAQLRKASMAPLLICLGLKPFEPLQGTIRPPFNPDAKHKDEKPPHDPGANMKAWKQRNLKLLLGIIKLRKISTNDLVEKSGLSRSTISNLADDLLKDGLITCDKSQRPWRFLATAKGKK